MTQQIQPRIILLKEGTDTSQGLPQIISNINACQAIAEAVRTTLGPRGMDKLIIDDRKKATISNDGATILKLLNVVHPAARILVDIAKSQDAQVGDGTTSVVILACEFLRQMKPFLEEGVHPRVVIHALRKGTQLALDRLNEIAVKSVEEYQKVVDTEWNILYDKLISLHKAGVKIVLSKLPIGDVATQWCADRDMFCAGRVPEEDLRRTQKACGGRIHTTVVGMTDATLGTCELFEEIQIGADRYNLFNGCPRARTCTIVLRGGAEQFMEETERSLHDAIMIVRRARKNDSVVAGGGAIDMELSYHLRQHSRSVSSKQQLLIGAMAKAFELIPRQLCDNAGFDATFVLNKLRNRHANGELWAGVDIQREDVADNFAACVWEPALVKANAIVAASEAACSMLSVDETVKNPASSSTLPNENKPVKPGRGMGRPC